MAQKSNLEPYELLCWGACIEGYPCGMDYKGKRYETGEVIDLPAEVAARHIAKGRLKPVVRAPKDEGDA